MLSQLGVSPSCDKLKGALNSFFEAIVQLLVSSLRPFKRQNAHVFALRRSSVVLQRDLRKRR